MCFDIDIQDEIESLKISLGVVSKSMKKSKDSKSSLPLFLETVDVGPIA